MTTNPDRSVLAGWFDSVLARTRDSRQRAAGSASRLGESFDAAALRTEKAAASVAATRLSIEHKPLPPIELDEVMRRLEALGASVLTGREKRALLSQPALVPYEHISEVLRASPALARHLVRACLIDWRSFCTQPWGASITPLAVHYARASGVGLFQGEMGPAKELLRRVAPPGTTVVAEALVGAPLERAHEYVSQTLGLRDAWLYTAEVLAVWVQQRLAHGLPLDDALRSIRASPALRAMLLPAVPGEAVASGVRSDEGIHGETVAALFNAAYRSPPLLSGSAFAELSGVLMRSSFGDPRLPPLSAGWTHVRRLAEINFRRFMTSLAEQDLEVFFAYAMNENDRRMFWLSYLPMIERTGCVLDAGLRQSLYEKVSGDENLRAAVQRTHRFKRASATQAFYLVFPQHVVVEFSTTGNAAYVYRRDLFESAIEKRIQRRAIESVSDLKLKEQDVYRIHHGGQWQSKTAQWLSAEGIHSKKRW